MPRIEMELKGMAVSGQFFEDRRVGELSQDNIQVFLGKQAMGNRYDTMGFGTEEAEGSLTVNLQSQALAVTELFRCGHGVFQHLHGMVEDIRGGPAETVSK